MSRFIKHLEKLPSTIGLLGAGGNLGSAVGKGLLRNPQFTSELLISGRDQSKLQPLQKLGARSVSNKELSQCEAILVFTKPNDLSSALAQIQPTLRPETLVLPFAAGRIPHDIARQIGSGKQVVCGMTSLAVEIGAGVTFLCAHEDAPERQRLLANYICDLMGDVFWFDDKDSHKLHLATAIAGCSPAYFAHVVEVMQKAGQKLGIDDPVVAEKVAQATMLSTAKLMAHKKISATKLKQSVTTPNGVTYGGLLKLAGLEELFKDVFAGNIKRCEEMAPASAKKTVEIDAKTTPINAPAITSCTTSPSSSRFLPPPQKSKPPLQEGQQGPEEALTSPLIRPEKSY